MPYEWSDADRTAQTPVVRLVLWPHRSLTGQGYVAFFAITFGMLMLPLIAVLGSKILWGLLPFLMGALALMWAFLRRNDKDLSLREDLTLSPSRIALTRTNPRGPSQNWEANPHWVQVALHATGGPVENYLTLRGSGREVELGAFLSPEERQTLHGDLLKRLAQMR